MHNKGFLLICIVFTCLGCARSVDLPGKVPNDKDSIDYYSLSITVSFVDKALKKEGGHISGKLFRDGLRVGFDTVWADGSKATLSIKVTSQMIKDLDEALTNEFKEITPIYTYSRAFDDVERDPSLGITTTDYFIAVEKKDRVSFRFSGVKGSYNRNKWISIPMSQVNDAFWNRTEKVFAEDERLMSFIKGFRLFWKNNA